MDHGQPDPKGALASCETHRFDELGVELNMGEAGDSPVAVDGVEEGDLLVHATLRHAHRR